MPSIEEDASDGRQRRQVAKLRPGGDQHERLQRNWAELLQELRVTQTGIQLLAGFH